MAIDHERAEVPGSRRCRGFVAVALTALLVGRVTAVAQTPSPSGPTVTVQPSETWPAVRNRMFPVEALQRANPRLDAEMLHPGEIVRAPYVHVSELADERAAREALKRQLTQAQARLTELGKQSAALETVRREVTQAQRSVLASRATMIALVVVVIGLLALLGLTVRAWLAVRQHAAAVAARDRALRARYDELRQALHDMDVKAQSRVVSLLRLHGGKIVTEAELAASVATVVDFADELRKRHEAA